MMSRLSADQESRGRTLAWRRHRPPPCRRFTFSPGGCPASVTLAVDRSRKDLLKVFIDETTPTLQVVCV